MITTKNINGRDDWYQAIAKVNGKIYHAFEFSRHAAFMGVARQLANAGVYQF